MAWLKPFLLGLLATMSVGAAAATVTKDASAGTALTDQQILVMVRMAPAHFRPGAGYDGDYGGPQAESARKRLAKRIARRHDLALVDGWPMPLLDVDCFVMEVRGRSADAAATEVSRDPAVAWSQPMHLYRTQGLAAPNDPLFAAQPAAKLWQLASLHRLATGHGVTVAVVDSGIDTAHPDLHGQIAANQNFVPGRPLVAEQHGTAVAGIIAAREANGVGIAGVAPGARILGLRACWQHQGQPGTTLCDSLSLARALHAAIDRKVPVINLSLSGPKDELLGRLLDIGIGRGVAIVTAFDEATSDGGFPASHPGVLAVADEQMTGSARSVYIAPGHDIPTTLPGGRWNLVNGSSYAAAHVSGLIALVRERQHLPGGKLQLVSARAGGGAIDPCATLLLGSSGRASSCAAVPQIATAETR